jgi:MFS superfamily sulfate permease-like transporter
VPVAALGAVPIFAAFSLFDIGTLREIWKYDRLEVGLSLITTLGVVAVRAINGILIAVALALARFVRQARAVLSNESQAGRVPCPALRREVVRTCRKNLSGAGAVPSAADYHPRDPKTHWAVEGTSRGGNPC